MIKDPPSHSRNTGSTSDLGRSHVPRNNQALCHSYRARTPEPGGPQLRSPRPRAQGDTATQPAPQSPGGHSYRARTPGPGGTQLRNLHPGARGDTATEPAPQGPGGHSYRAHAPEPGGPQLLKRACPRACALSEKGHRGEKPGHCS